MTSLRPRIAPCLLLLGLVAACGDDEDGSTTSTTEASSTGAGGAGPTTSATTGGSGGAGGEGGEGGGGGSAGIAIPGLDGAVTVTVDEHGVHHVACTVDDDCFAALGWFHAQNRFFFMDFVRNLVRGSLGSLVKAGPLVLEQDYANRRFFTTRDGEPLEDALYDQATDRVKGHLDAYTRGVNAWIADMRAGRNGATLTTEYDFALIEKAAIRDWEPADSAAVGLYVMNDLSNNSGAEIQTAAAAPAFDPALAADLFSTDSVFDAFTAPPQLPPVGLPIAADPYARLQGARPLLASAAAQVLDLAAGRSKVPGESGSNNWIVAPERTAGGNPLVANDPHLLLTNPSIWFPAEIDARSGGEGEYHMAGGTFPGLPAVMVGHNESIAWGVTTVYWDLADVYVEELTDDGSAVVFDGAEVPIVERAYEFADLASGQTQTRTFRWVPHHGPIVEEDLDAGTAISIRWRGHDGGQDLDAFFAVGRASSVDEARVGLAEHATSANQNFVIADVDGNIGWFPYSRVPSRPWASPELPPWLPVPGDGSAEWGPPVPMDELPQLVNPPSGAIATANQDLTGAGADGDPTNDGQAAHQTRVKGEGTRQQRILDLLEAGGDEHTVETMVAIQGDTFSLYGEMMTPLLLEAAAGMTLDADQQALVDALDGWDFTCPTGLATSDPEGAASADEGERASALGCTAFHIALSALVEQTLRDEVEAAGLGYGVDVTGTNLVARAFTEPDDLVTGEAIWDDVNTDAIETRIDVAARAIARAALTFVALGDADDRLWGRVHTLTLRSIYDNFGVATYNDGPHAAPGGLHTVNVASPWTGPLPASGGVALPFAGGPSIRLVSEVTADGPRMVFQLPGGADLHRESDFYNNLLPLWLENEPVTFAFGAGAVEEPYATIEVQPAD